MMTAEMVLGTLLDLLFSHLMQLLAPEGFIQYHIVSKDCQQKLQFKIILK
jgi:hypothetical protein